MKPYVKVEGLPDLLLRYERDKNSMNLSQMEIIAFLNLSSRGAYFFHDCKSLDDDHLFLLDNHHES